SWLAVALENAACHAGGRGGSTLRFESRPLGQFAISFLSKFPLQKSKSSFTLVFPLSSQSSNSYFLNVDITLLVVAKW
ncbi:hypothetical protein CKO50_06405, partial [Pseudoalteromonas sp. HM-SA03]|uniref:hypothetical protein n=1 Tax=Pseudoalteromonas sp. HM-SA03 TaxID=2029678 RepID=UPI000BCFD489